MITLTISYNELKRLIRGAILTFPTRQVNTNDSRTSPKNLGAMSQTATVGGLVALFEDGAAVQDGAQTAFSVRLRVHST